MNHHLVLILTSSLALSACITEAQPSDAPTQDAPTQDAPTQDAVIVDDATPRDGGLDAWFVSDVDASPDDLCARAVDPERCEASGCTWRGDACVALAECAIEEDPQACWRAGCVVASAERCLEPDDPSRCDDTESAGLCASRRCTWRRAQGDDRVGCWPTPAPSVQDCAQPDPATCEAAGCEWTGLGCAPPNQTPCDQLEDAACGARVECVQTAAGCAIDPDAACDGLAMEDCSTRVDCGVQGFLCVDLPQDPCGESPQWVCEQRPDCEALRPDCTDAPKGGNNGQGEGGEGGGGQPLCEGPADCEGGEGCLDGICISCDTYIGCADR